MYMGVESALLGSIVTTIGGLFGVVLSKCRCACKRDEDGCDNACGFSDKPLTPEDHEIEVIKEHVDDVELLIISKKAP